MPPPADALAAKPANMDLLGLSDELVMKIFEWVGPRTVKRFGQTSRWCRAIVREYEVTAIYASTLVHRVLARFTNIIVSTTTREIVVKKDDFARLTAAAEVHARHVAATLAGCPAAKPLSAWNRIECLQLLYPAATGLPDSTFAPYALEWCARHERDILGKGALGGRRDLEALLSADALWRLAAMRGVSERAVVRLVIDNLTVAARTSSCRCHEAAGQVAEMVIMMAAVSACITGWDSDPPLPPLMKDRLSALGKVATIFCPSKLLSEDRAWLKLAGLGKESGARSPHKLLGEFVFQGASARPATPQATTLMFVFVVTDPEGPAAPPEGPAAPPEGPAAPPEGPAAP